MNGEFVASPKRNLDKWVMGNGEWVMGNGEWGMGNGEWGMGEELPIFNF